MSGCCIWVGGWVILAQHSWEHSQLMQKTQLCYTKDHCCVDVFNKDHCCVNVFNKKGLLYGAFAFCLNSSCWWHSRQLCYRQWRLPSLHPEQERAAQNGLRIWRHHQSKCICVLQMPFDIGLFVCLGVLVGVFVLSATWCVGVSYTEE